MNLTAGSKRSSKIAYFHTELVFIAFPKERIPAVSRASCAKQRH